MEFDSANQMFYPEPASAMLPVIRYSRGDSGDSDDAGYVTPVSDSANGIESSPGGSSDTAESDTTFERNTGSGLKSPQVSEELKQKVKTQIEYYFSDENLLKDSFLLKHINRNKQGYVSLKLVASLRKIKSLTKDWEVVLGAVMCSDLLEINAEKTKIRRKAPPPQIDMTHVSKTLVATNLSDENTTVAQLEQIFGRYGGIQHVRILQPGKAVPIDVKKYKSCHPDIGKQLCAIVEYDTVEAATTAQQKLDTSQSWRQGMLVGLLDKESKSQDNKLTETDDKKKGQTKQEVESRLQKSEKQAKRGDRTRQKKSTHITSPDTSRRHLNIEEKRDCASDSGISRGSSPSPDRQRSRRPVFVFTKSVKSDCSTRIVRQPLGPDGSKGFKLQTVS